MSVIAGGGIAVQRKKSRWHPITGWSGEAEYQGTLANVNLLVSTFQAQRLPFELEYYDGNPYTTFVVRTADAGDGSPIEDQIVDQWGLVTNDLEKNILEAQATLDLGAETVKDILKRVSTVNDDEDNYTIDTTTLQGDSLSLYLALIRGWPSSVIVPQFVLQNAKSLPPGVGVDPGYFNFGGVVIESTAKLVETFAIPVNVLPFTIPAGQWLAKGANVAPQPDGKATFTQEYWHADLWPSYPYKLRVA